MYFIVYGLLYLLSLLPLRVLYIISDAVYALLYYIIGYRRMVVKNNLLIAFPEKTTAERRSIEKQFYKNFTDNFIETLKLLSGGSKFALKHFSADASIMQQQFDKGKRVQFHMGHHFNWEMGNIAMSSLTSFPMLMVYLPVQSKTFEKLMLKIRSSSGNHLMPATHLRQAMMPFRNTQYLLALIADQVPGDVSKAYWLNFFGKPTPFIRGPERGAVAGNLPVMFGEIFKIKRGHYILNYELCTEDPASLPKGELTRRYVRYLENAIREHPSMWLWSHRRWKREWKREYESLWIGEDSMPDQQTSN
ncbi:MAG: lysophospholipid acyltransferase family protein [Chitinophagaceae bacterium]|nr:lysophospholipid acyltransferase family protein [Chitinophagaceae bacterium]